MTIIQTIKRQIPHKPSFENLITSTYLFFMTQMSTQYLDTNSTTCVGIANSFKILFYLMKKKTHFNNQTLKISQVNQGIKFE